MKDNFKIFVFSFCFLFLILSFKFCFAKVLSSTELIENAKEYDGKVVVYQGEAIGEKIKRGNFFWVNVSSGKQAIGVWLPQNLMDKIKYLGNYKTRGDWIEVKGIFHQACFEHGGDLDIHAESISVISSGGIKEESLDIDKRNLAMILLGGLILGWILSLFRKK